MLPLDRINHHTFEPLLNQTFTLSGTDHALALELVEVMPLRQRTVDARLPFSLLFRAPADAQVAQGTYRIDHSELGAMDLFLVPTSADQSGWFVEAVFN